MARTTTKRVKIQIEGEDKTKSAFDQLKKSGTNLANSFNEISDAVNKVLGAINALAQQTALRRSFEQQGLSIEKVRRSTRGLVSDYDLMLARSQSVALGLGLNNEQFADLAQGAIQLGQAMGRNAADSIDDLIVGLGRQSVKILDNLGIIVKAEQAYNDFAEANGKAAKDLNDVEKRAAFTEAALRQLRARTEGTQIATDSLASAVSRLDSAFNNLMGAVGTAADDSGFLAQALDNIKISVDFVTDAMTGSGDTGAIGALIKYTSLWTPLIALLEQGEQQFDSITKRNREAAKASQEVVEESQQVVDIFGRQGIVDAAAAASRSMKAYAEATKTAAKNTKDLVTAAGQAQGVLNALRGLGAGQRTGAGVARLGLLRAPQQLSLQGRQAGVGAGLGLEAGPGGSFQFGGAQAETPTRMADVTVPGFGEEATAAVSEMETQMVASFSNITQNAIIAATTSEDAMSVILSGITAMLQQLAAQSLGAIAGPIAGAVIGVAGGIAMANRRKQLSARAGRRSASSIATAQRRGQAQGIR